jgi:molecular chaperone DnaJ
MMAKRDYYEVLSVERTATEVEIKRSYRKMALELHPDRNPGDKQAEERFKECSEAYAVLSDADKRAAYDRFGHQGLSGSGQAAGFSDMQDIFSQFGDIFGDLFGGGGGGRRARRDGPQAGADLRTVVKLSLKDAVLGTKDELPLHHPGPCEPCSGTGAEGGKRKPCTRCQGTGQVAHARGPFLLQSTCQTCHGVGSTAERACASCHGTGQVEVKRTVKVTFPAGIDDGQTLRVPGQGMQGTRGGPPGHLYVEVRVEGDPRFERDGFDLVHLQVISFAEAALGTERQIDGLDGQPIRFAIPAGVQPGDTVIARGQGVPRLGATGRGDLIVQVQVRVPKKLSRKARQLVEQLQEELPEE